MKLPISNKKNKKLGVQFKIEDDKESNYIPSFRQKILI